MKTYEAYNIEYDTDGNHIRELPAKVPIQATSLKEAKLIGADQISDQTGWCVSCFNVREKITTHTLSKRIQYLRRRSQDGAGVTQPFIKRLRTDVQKLLGTTAFRYLEQHIDAREGRWNTSSAFSWPDMLLATRRRPHQ